MAADDPGGELEAFNAEYRRSVPGRLGEIENLWSELGRGEASRERMHALLRSVHSIAGSGTTFGMPRLSEAAAAAESWFQPFYEQGAMPDESRRAEFEALLAALKAAAAA